MKRLFFILLFGLFSIISNGQNADTLFAASKGTWNFPLKNVIEIDTMGTDCFGMPANSYAIVLKTACPEEVKTLQPGVVRAVREYDGTYAVMIQSGDFFLVYLGLSKPSCTSGDTVLQGSVLGTLTNWSERTFELTLMLLKVSKMLTINRWFNWKTVYINKSFATPVAQ